MPQQLLAASFKDDGSGRGAQQAWTAAKTYKPTATIPYVLPAPYEQAPAALDVQNRLSYARNSSAVQIAAPMKAATSKRPDHNAIRLLLLFPLPVVGLQQQQLPSPTQHSICSSTHSSPTVPIAIPAIAHVRAANMYGYFIGCRKADVFVHRLHPPCPVGDQYTSPAC